MYSRAVPSKSIFPKHLSGVKKTSTSAGSEITQLRNRSVTEPPAYRTGFLATSVRRWHHSSMLGQMPICLLPQRVDLVESWKRSEEGEEYPEEVHERKTCWGADRGNPRRSWPQIQQQSAAPSHCWLAEDEPNAAWGGERKAWENK